MPALSNALFNGYVITLFAALFSTAETQDYVRAGQERRTPRKGNE